MKRDRVSTTLEALAGIVITISGLLTAVLTFFEKSSEVIALPKAVGNWAFWLGAGILCLLGSRLFVRSRIKPSALLKPEAMRLFAANPHHLIGRQDEIAQLERLCLDHTLIFLTGESGAGKTALVQAGLAPVLRANRRFLPLYVQVWGQDWEEGPRVATAQALWNGLTAEQREDAGLEKFPDGLGQLFEHLLAIRQTLGITPLLIFDQFDDYQTRHRIHFFAEQGRTWLSAAAVRERNVFWDGVAGLLNSDRAHCLFVTRADRADGLEAVRFTEPRIFRLDRLQGRYVGSLLARLTATEGSASPIVQNPQQGWTKLSERLERDLVSDGFALPQQVNTVLAGLQQLRHLTTADYDRVGQTVGLEALHIEACIRGAARKASISEDVVRALLLKMTESAGPRKTSLQTVPQLQELAGVAEFQQIEGALQELANAGVTRETLEAV